MPEHRVGGVEQDRRVDRVLQRDRGVDVVVVAVGQRDGRDLPAADGLDDRPVVVGGVDHHHLAVVADQPDVVGDLPLAAVEAEDAVGGDQLDHGGEPTGG